MNNNKQELGDHLKASVVLGDLEVSRASMDSMINSDKEVKEAPARTPLGTYSRSSKNSLEEVAEAREEAVLVASSKPRARISK